MRNGFTLIELLIVIGIISIVGGLGLSSINSLRYSVEVNNVMNMFRQIMQKARNYALNNVGNNNNQVSAWVVSVQEDVLSLFYCDFTNTQVFCSKSSDSVITSDILISFGVDTSCSGVGYSVLDQKLIGVSDIPVGNLLSSGVCKVFLEDNTKSYKFASITIDITSSSISYEKY